MTAKVKASPTDARPWIDEITAAEKEAKKFHERARMVNRRFLDERDIMTKDSKWFNIFYANTNILTSALYAQLPKPMVNRRFKDFDDEVARVAGIILQRCITQDLDDPRDTFDSTMRQSVQDRLVPGLAQAWIRLETDTVPIEDVDPPAQPDSQLPPTEQEVMMQIANQRVIVDYVYWEDFLWSPCRVWAERRWVGRKVYMDKDELKARFGAKAENVPCNYQPKRITESAAQISTPEDLLVKKAVVVEIWERKSRKVIWVCPGFPTILDEKADPLGLTGFEPCPMPMMANLSTTNCMPRPDYYMLQDQYNELDSINNRISNLVRACKVVGVYDKGATGVARMLNEGVDNQLIPVDNWAMFAEKGGIKGQVDWLPLEQVVQALTQLQMAREAIKAQIYELTGIADIVRGASKASETLGAQEIKAQFASVRIKKLQDEVSRFAAEILRIKAEIICKHFDRDIILRDSNIEYTQDGQDPGLVEQALALLQSQQEFEWRIVVTADSIAQADYDMEKKDRMEFLTAVSAYLEKAGAMFQAVPQSASLLVGMLKWAVAGFKNAAEIEGMLDKELDNLTKNPPQDKPSPEEQKLEAEKARDQAKLELEQQKQQQEMALKEREAQLEQQMMEMKMRMEQQQAEMKLQLEREMGQIKLWLAQMMANVKLEESQQKMQLQQVEGQQQLEQNEQEHALHVQSARQDQQLNREAKEQDIALAAKAQKQKAQQERKPNGRA